jgi:hypothetical protein
MPSPFPGMDPFLENPIHFPDLHTSLHWVIRETLQKKLPEPYFAVLSERLWVEMNDRYIEPDVDVMRSRTPPTQAAEKGELMTLATRSQPVLISIPHDERRESFVEIRTKNPYDEERIVTTIEVLSLTNKTPGEKGRELYLRKQREILDGDIHLVEIDLLRGGEHTTAVPRWRIEREAGPFDYHVAIHPYDSLEDYYVYPFKLEESLPEVAVPLLPGDGGVAVDLQIVLNRCYDTGPYSRRVKYDISRLVPPLPAKQTRWVKQRLRQIKSS